MIYTYIDLFLYVAMLFDLGWKIHKLNKVKSQICSWRRYQPHQKEKRLFSISVLILNIIYLIYRFYRILIVKNTNIMNWVVILPLLLYYGLLIYFTDGIYYNNKALFYKQELIYYGDLKYCYRTLDKGVYEYNMTYKQRNSGERDLTLCIKEEPSAFALLGTIPFKDLDE